MQVCISLQTDNHASTPPLKFLQAGCPSCRPTKQRQSTEGKALKDYTNGYPDFEKNPLPISLDPV